MTRRKVTRMTDRDAAPDAGQEIAQQLAQLDLAHDELGADSGAKLTQDPAAQPKEQEQNGEEKDETKDDDDQELAQQLSLIHLDNKSKSQKRRIKKKENMKKKKDAERKVLEEKTTRENEAEGPETAREKEVREMAQKMADDIIKKMGILQISEKTTSANTTKTETETTAKQVTPKKNKKLNVKKLFEDWSEYFGEGDLEDWQRLCRDLGLPGDLPSKTKCRDAIKGVHVNIRQFLDAQRKPEDVKFFKNVYKLANWTASTHLRVPLDLIPRGTPLRDLMRKLSRY